MYDWRGRRSKKKHSQNDSIVFIVEFQLTETGSFIYNTSAFFLLSIEFLGFQKAYEQVYIVIIWEVIMGLHFTSEKKNGLMFLKLKMK